MNRHPAPDRLRRPGELVRRAGAHLPSRLAVLGNLARNGPLTASVATKFMGRGRAAAASAALRAMPTGLRRRLLPLLDARVLRTLLPQATGLHALGVAADGRTADAVAELEAAAEGSGRRRRGALVDALVVLHRADVARRVAGGGPIPPVVEGRLLAEEGHYRQALDVLGSRRAAAALVDQLTGDLAALDAPARVTPAAPESVPSRARRAGRTASRGPRSVTHLVTTALPEAQTGYTIRTQGIAQAQASSGLDVEVISRLGFPVDTGHPYAPAHRRVGDVDYHRLLPFRRLPARADARLDEAIDLVGARVAARHPAILHAHSKHDNAQVALAVGRARAIPVVYEVRGFLEETWRTRGGDPASDHYLENQQAETTCMRAADAVVTLSHTMRARILARGVDAERVHVIPNAVPDAYLEPVPSRAEARATLGIDPLAPVLGVAGTLNAYEGLDTVIEAMALVADPRLVFLVVGAGPDRDRLEALAARTGVDVRFTGRVPHGQVRRHIAAMDLFCVARGRTPVTEVVPPLKPLEALATGVPVLASDLPPLAELMAEAEEGEPFGWLAPAGDPARWAEELRRLAYDPAHLARAGNAGRQWATRERTWSRLVQSYEAVYREAQQSRRT